MGHVEHSKCFAPSGDIESSDHAVGKPPVWMLKHIEFVPRGDVSNARSQYWEKNWSTCCHANLQIASLQGQGRCIAALSGNRNYEIFTIATNKGTWYVWSTNFIQKRRLVVSFSFPFLHEKISSNPSIRKYLSEIIPNHCSTNQQAFRFSGSLVGQNQWNNGWRGNTRIVASASVPAMHI